MKRQHHIVIFLLFLLGISFPNGMAIAQTINTDSLKMARQKQLDSLKTIQNQRRDSIAEIRKYKESKHYKDSLTNARQLRIDSMKAERQQFNDSLKAERQRVADSARLSRQVYNDSLKNYRDSVREERMAQLESQKLERQKVSDSLAARRKYRESKQYKDSVAYQRQERLDSITAVRKSVADSIRTVQKDQRDSLMAVRKVYNDSIRSALDSTRAARQLVLDSLTTARKLRSDSLKTVREEREAARTAKLKEKEQEKEEKLKLALELKIQKKQEEYSNEKMKKKKWTIPRQIVQNTFTRYNYYFNADAKMDEAIDNMVRSNVDNYDSLLALFPFDPDRDSAKLSNDMDTIIRKASVGIQIHDPRSKWQDNLYLLVGQAYFYKGSYDDAGSAFKFIVAEAEEAKKNREKGSKNKPKPNEKKPLTFAEEEKTGFAGLIEHTSSKNEAMLWLSRTLAQADKIGQAQTLLDMLKNDAVFPKSLEGRLAVEQAFIDIKQRDYSQATQSLAIVSEDRSLPDWIKQRASFLNAQLLQQQNKLSESDVFFKRAINLHPPLEMDFYARKNIAFNSLNNPDGGNEEAIAMLEKMSSDFKYNNYFDQIFYILGKSALQNKNSKKAIEYFRESIAKSQNNPLQKGLSFTALGDQYYQLLDYNNAKLSYDSATMFLTEIDQPEYGIAMQRASSLDKIAIPGNSVKVADSLLYLASLSEKEQRSIIRNYIRALERMLADSLFSAQNSGQNQNSSSSSNMNKQGQTWYFANPTLMKQGENDFKKKWGNRQLKDNWRRSSNSFASGSDYEVEEEASEKDLIAAMLPDPDTLFAAIPKTNEELQSIKDQLQQDLFDLGKGYYVFLEDYPNAIHTFDTLDKRFPNHKNEAEVYYTRYLISMRENKIAEAGKYNNDLQTKYPESEWAKQLKSAMASSREIDQDKQPQKKISTHYDETYKFLIERQFSDVLKRVKDAEDMYPNRGTYTRKYELMKAIAIAGQGNYPEADTMISKFIVAGPGDSLAEWAGNVLNFIRKNPSASNTTTEDKKFLDSASLVYVYQPETPHYVIIESKQDSKFMGLRSGLSDYNLMNEGNEDISVNISTLEGERALIVCRKFKNANEAKRYLNKIKNVKGLFREYENNKGYNILSISEDNFSRLLAKKSITEYDEFWKKNYK